MKRLLFVLLAICTLTAAMHIQKRASDDSDSMTEKYCSTETPCAWSLVSKIDTEVIKNTYCNCEPGTSCEKENILNDNNSYVHTCKAPKGQS